MGVTIAILLSRRSKNIYRVLNLETWRWNYAIRKFLPSNQSRLDCILVHYARDLDLSHDKTTTYINIRGSRSIEVSTTHRLLPSSTSSSFKFQPLYGISDFHGGLIDTRTPSTCVFSMNLPGRCLRVYRAKKSWSRCLDHPSLRVYAVYGPGSFVFISV